MKLPVAVNQRWIPGCDTGIRLGLVMRPVPVTLLSHTSPTGAVQVVGDGLLHTAGLTPGS
jgi:hypothetical protein